MPKFDKFNTLIIFLLALTGVLVLEYFVSVIALVLALISLGLGVYISPRVLDELQERKKVRKEKKIEKLEKELEDLKTEVV